ncbi:MAG: hypothetical protein SGILL_005551 [Bacillariaceae sp.]
MKGSRMKNAILDSDSEDDADDEFDIGQLTKSIQRVKLDDDGDDSMQAEDDSSVDDDETKASSDDSTGTISMSSRHKQSIGTLSSLTDNESSSVKDTDSDSDERETSDSEEDEFSDRARNEKSPVLVSGISSKLGVKRLSVSDDSSMKDSGTDDDNEISPAKKPSVAASPAKRSYYIADELSSSSSSEDSLDEYLKSSARMRSRFPKKGIAAKPPKKKIELYPEKDSDSSDMDSKPSAKSKKNTWSFNKIRREYTIGGDGKMPPFSVPEDLYEQLYEFQKDGVKWLVGLHNGKIGGCLGDDMGMGKTYMTLTMLGGLFRAKTIRKALVIAPVSVLRNWEKEGRKILSKCVKANIQVIASETSKFARAKKLRAALESQSPQLVITTFGLISSSPDQFQHHRYSWDYIILDEAHKIKNPKAQVSQNTALVARDDDTRRLILTGTPIMNNLQELHSIFTFCTSGKVLGDHRDFQDNFGKPIEAARSSDATESELERGENAMKDLQQLLHPYFLQRMKVDYLADSLPPKKEYVLWTNLSPYQRDIYHDYVTSKDKGVADYLRGLETSPLFAITWLQKLCGHPLLVNDENGVLPTKNLEDVGAGELFRQSAKLKVMYDLVLSLRQKRHRTLIFSQSTKVLDLIQYVLEESVNLGRIDGQTKEKDRQRFVDAFNDGDSIDAMLISTKAGGQGLTLTGADTVIVYDPSWNPAEDAQAVDRCYRIGQKKPVTVYRLVTAGTVEEKRYEKQIHKDGVRRAILTSAGTDTAKYFTKEELLRKQVFVLGEEGQCDFLTKLNERGFNSLEDVDPEVIFTSHPGVVGQSSHDVVYSLPDNWDKVEDPKDAPAPFSSPSSKGKWYESKNKNGQPKKVVGKAKRVLLKTENSGGPETSDKENGGDMKNEPLVERQVDGGPLQAKQSFGEQMGRAKQLRASGEGVKAMETLMDVKYEKLNSDEKMEFHKNIASTSKELGWLEEA